MAGYLLFVVIETVIPGRDEVASYDAQLRI
ncbi:hypothetical protein ACVIIV_002340 [Bradyrhizobium sp. USDA 4354]